uniref:Carbohydrate kinase PfkB domain-containing protein n=1 Tax=Meloidogyne enterolobii TaxID=390850 RepID=A0A6V7XFE7_MELEN|nr:unnamed protein product [Meloidogyne enterolobii]
MNFEQHMYGRPKVVCIGSAIVDIEVLSTEETKESKKGEISYFPAEIKQRAGGVARNHAEALARLGIDVDLISAFGIDLNGDPDIGATFLFKKMGRTGKLGLFTNLYLLELFCEISHTPYSLKNAVQQPLFLSNQKRFFKYLLDLLVKFKQRLGSSARIY